MMMTAVFTTFQYRTIQNACGKEFASFLGKLGLATPDFSSGEAKEAGRQMNAALDAALCKRLHSENRLEGYMAILKLAHLPAPASDTNEELLARIVEHQKEILAACRRKEPEQRQKPAAARKSSVPESARQQASDNASGSLPILAGVCAAVGIGAAASAAGAPAGIAGLAAVASGCATFAGMKERARRETQKMKQHIFRTSSRPALPPRQNDKTPRPFSWDRTSADELAETLDLLKDLDKFARASHRG